MRLCALILLTTLMISCDYYVVNPYRENIGQISKSKIGNSDFKPCFEEQIYNHYRSWKPAKFEPGKDSLRNYYLSKYDNLGIINESGYVTLRFVLNCKGEKGWYEIKQLGLDFEEKEFNKLTVDQLFDLTEALGSWTPIVFDDNNFDSYFHLTFKIDNGELVEILP